MLGKSILTASITKKSFCFSRRELFATTQFKGCSMGERGDRRNVRTETTFARAHDLQKPISTPMHNKCQQKTREHQAEVDVNYNNLLLIHRRLKYGTFLHVIFYVLRKNCWQKLAPLRESFFNYLVPHIYYKDHPPE